MSASDIGGGPVVYEMHEEELAVGDMSEPAAFLEGSGLDSPYMTTVSAILVLKMDLPSVLRAVIYRLGVLRAPTWDMLFNINEA